MNVAVVTGANRGLGLETARQLLAKGWSVVLTGRRLEKVQAAVAGLQPAEGARAVAFELDITNPEHGPRLAAFVGQEFGRLDALVNNAGAIYDDRRHPEALVAKAQALRDSYETNAIGPFQVTLALAELLMADGGANVVMVSTGMAGLAEMGGGYPGYRMSKTALNALTRIFHHEMHDAGVRVNCVCPGWVRTDMGGSSASRSVPDGASGITWAATLPADGPSGGFFRDGNAIPW
jgi:NAD(P)-dependent dehydrogenase (short-subunit alcohol dehydrogenase family)